MYSIVEHLVNNDLTKLGAKFDVDNPYKIIDCIKSGSKTENEKQLDLIEFVECFLEQYPELKGTCRKRELVDRRYYIYTVLKKGTGLSKTAIGVIFDKDHASVIHGLRQAEHFIETNNPDYLLNIKRLHNEMSNFLL